MYRSNIEKAYSLRPGDVLVRNKSFLGVIDHYGLYVGNGQIIDNHPARGVSIIGLSSFLNGRKLKQIKRFEGNSYKRNQVINKAHSMIGMNYHLTQFNCEHFVTEAWGAGRQSRQVSAAGLLIFSILTIWGLSKSS